MNKHINKFAAVLCVVTLISCNKKEVAPEPGQKSQPATASEFFLYNYWVIGASFSFAENYINTNNKKLEATGDPCAKDIAAKLSTAIGKSHDLLLQSEQEEIKIIAQNIDEDELQAANKYFKTASIGRYIASQAGVTEMGRVLRTSKYNTELQHKLSNPDLTSDNRMEISIGYMLKMLPEQETLAYTSFRNLPLWDHLEAIRPQLEGAMKPYTDNSHAIAELNDQLRTCPSMATARQDELHTNKSKESNYLRKTSLSPSTR